MRMIMVISGDENKYVPGDSPRIGNSPRFGDSPRFGGSPAYGNALYFDSAERFTRVAWRSDVRV